MYFESTSGCRVGSTVEAPQIANGRTLSFLVSLILSILEGLSFLFPVPEAERHTLLWRRSDFEEQPEEKEVAGVTSATPRLATVLPVVAGRF